MPTVDKYGNVRESLKLKPAQWEKLSSIAEDTESIPPTAPKDNPKASWRTLLKRIADGELIVTVAA